MKMQDISLLKGIHPGIILGRELAKKHLPKSRFALSIGEYPTIISDITNGKRKMNTELALRIEHALGFEEGFFMILQTFYEIKQIKDEQSKNYHPNLSVFRKSLFWDTDINNINWIDQKEAIIRRTFERGNDAEKQEILRFYGETSINEILSSKQKTKSKN